MILMFWVAYCKCNFSWYSAVQLHSSAERIIILEKQPVDLECIPTVTDLTISWKFDILQPGFIDYNYFTFSPLNHTLTISDPRIEYSGEYICQILYYHEINRTITLEILSGNLNYTSC